MENCFTSDGTSIQLDSKLGGGGEGDVFTYSKNGHADAAQVVKILSPKTLNQDKNKKSKLKVMMQNHPFENVNDKQLAKYRDCVAWPTELIFDQRKRFVGYAMPMVSAVEINQIINPSNRNSMQRVMSSEKLYQIAYHVAVLFKGLHSKNYVIGDINSKNILVRTNNRIVMVDCDSIQVTTQDGVVYPCKVGVPEYTPPELRDKDLSTVNRTENHDCFGLAILIFQLIMQGFHPFSGKYTTGKKDIPDITKEFIKRKIFPYKPSSKHNVMAPPIAPDFEQCIPKKLQVLFERAFTQDVRPSAAEWEKELAVVLTSFRKCEKDASHNHPHGVECTVCNWQSKQTAFSQPLPKIQTDVSDSNANSNTTSSTTGAPNTPTPVQTPTARTRPQPSVQVPPPQQKPGNFFDLFVTNIANYGYKLSMGFAVLLVALVILAIGINLIITTIDCYIGFVWQFMPTEDGFWGGFLVGIAYVLWGIILAVVSAIIYHILDSIFIDDFLMVIILVFIWSLPLIHLILYRWIDYAQLDIFKKYFFIYQWFGVAPLSPRCYW